MMSIRGYALVLGAAALISFIVVGIVVSGYNPDSIIPRESICVMPAAGEGWLSGYPDAMMARTGIDTGPVRLTRFRAGIGPDGVPASIDLDFYTGTGGEGRLYQIAYRRDAGTCGWLDGISYPEQSGMTPGSLPVDTGRALSAIGQVRFDVQGLTGRSLILETGPLATQVPGAGEPVPDVVLFENGTPAHPDSEGACAAGLMPFSLLVSEKTCTPVQWRDPLCSISPLLRIRFVDPS